MSVSLTKNCSECGKIFSKKVNCSMKEWLATRKFCNRSCSDKHTLLDGSKQPTRKQRATGSRNRNWKGGKVVKSCAICTKDFAVDPFRSVTAKTCSRVCSNAFRRLPENRKSMSEVHRKRVDDGLHNVYWGLKRIANSIRCCSLYKQWRTAIYERDNYTCQMCGIRGGKLNADHKKAFSIILYEYNIRTYDDALRCGELWDTNNGRTLCKPCHLKTPTWGNRLNSLSGFKKITL